MDDGSCFIIRCFSYIFLAITFTENTTYVLFYYFASNVFFAERLSTESLHTHSATTKDSSVHVPATASVRDAMWLWLRANTVSENGFSCAASRHASD